MSHSKNPFLSVIALILIIAFTNCGFNHYQSSFYGGQFTVPPNKNTENTSLTLETITPAFLSKADTFYKLEYTSNSTSSVLQHHRKQLIKPANFSQNAPTNNLKSIKSHNHQSNEIKPEGPMNTWQTIETLLGFIIGMTALVLGTNFFLSALAFWTGLISFKLNISIKNLRYYKKENGLKTLSIITLLFGLITIILNPTSLSLYNILKVFGITFLVGIGILLLTKLIAFKWFK